MMFFVCSVILATGAWDCGTMAPLPLTDVVAAVYAANAVFPYKPGHSRSPYTLWPADKPVPSIENTP